MLLSVKIWLTNMLFVCCRIFCSNQHAKGELDLQQTKSQTFLCKSTPPVSFVTGLICWTLRGTDIKMDLISYENGIVVLYGKATMYSWLDAFKIQCLNSFSWFYTAMDQLTFVTGFGIRRIRIRRNGPAPRADAPGWVKVSPWRLGALSFRLPVTTPARLPDKSSTADPLSTSRFHWRRWPYWWDRAVIAYSIHDAGKPVQQLPLLWSVVI